MLAVCSGHVQELLLNQAFLLEAAALESRGWCVCSVGCKGWVDRAWGHRSPSVPYFAVFSPWLFVWWQMVCPHQKCLFQAALMISLIWKYYSVPVAVVPSKWITPLDRLVAFPTRVAGEDSLENTGQDSVGFRRGGWREAELPGIIVTICW